MKAGVTLIELLLVVAIITIIGAMTAPFAGQMYQRILLESGTNAVRSAWYKAQANSLAGKGDDSWGICHIGEVVRVYRGSCTNPAQKEDWYVGGVSISGMGETNFSRLRGEPTVARVVTVSNLAGANTITISLGGGIW